MPISPFQGQAFDPESTRAMGLAFDRLCASLGLVDRSDPMAELAAAGIITLVQMGIKDSDQLYLTALRLFNRTVIGAGHHKVS